MRDPIRFTGKAFPFGGSLRFLRKNHDWALTMVPTGPTVDLRENFDSSSPHDVLNACSDGAIAVHEDPSDSASGHNEARS